MFVSQPAYDPCSQPRCVLSSVRKLSKTMYHNICNSACIVALIGFIIVAFKSDTNNTQTDSQKKHVMYTSSRYFKQGQTIYKAAEKAVSQLRTDTHLFLDNRLQHSRSALQLTTHPRGFLNTHLKELPQRFLASIRRYSRLFLRSHQTFAHFPSISFVPLQPCVHLTSLFCLNTLVNTRSTIQYLQNLSRLFRALF